MGHHKLQRFAENLTFPNLFQVGFDQLEKEGFALRGRWHEQFGNNNPVTLELGCGKGDYTIALARIHPERNYIGVDIKGARLWRGAKTSNEEQMKNVAFIRTRIELIDRFFAPGEVSEIWITFCDPQLKKPNKRLTSPRFLDTYARFLAPGSMMHLKPTARNFTIIPSTKCCLRAMFRCFSVPTTSIAPTTTARQSSHRPFMNACSLRRTCPSPIYNGKQININNIIKY